MLLNAVASYCTGTEFQLYRTFSPPQFALLISSLGVCRSSEEVSNYSNFPRLRDQCTTAFRVGVAASVARGLRQVDASIHEIMHT